MFDPLHSIVKTCCSTYVSLLQLFHLCYKKSKKFINYNYNHHEMSNMMITESLQSYQLTRSYHQS